MDRSSIAGVALAVAGVGGGMWLEGVNLAQVTQPTALLIVLGGTLGAVMVQFPMAAVKAALQRSLAVFASHERDDEAVVERVVVLAMKARRSGVPSLEADVEGVEDGFFKRTLSLAVDGLRPAELRGIMELELDHAAEEAEHAVQVFEAAGGFAPTVGILGALIGLIQVMQHLNHIDQVGSGIAVAFVATIYGVGLANLLFLPMAGKLRIRNREEARSRELILEGVVAILEGMNPRMVDARLRTFLQHPEQAQPRTEQGMALPFRYGAAV